MGHHSVKHHRFAWGIRSLTFLFVFAFLVACDEEKPSDGGGASSSSSGGSSNLADYADNPCDLLPEAVVRAEIPEMPADAEHSTGTKRMPFCQYSWAGPRKGSREIMGKVMEYPVNDTVCLKWIRVLDVSDPLARFRNSYRTMTPEEEAQMAAAFQRVLDEKKAKGEISDAGAEAGKGLSGSLTKGIRFQNVEGVGTAAAWGGSMGSGGLKVLDGDTEFEISVDIYEDEAQNREAAIRLAKKILAAAR